MAKADKNLKEFYNSQGWHKKNNDAHYQDVEAGLRVLEVGI